MYQYILFNFTVRGFPRTEKGRATMKNKNSVFKKALSVLLTALLVFGTVSLGIVFPDTKITANALESFGDVALYVPEAVYLYPNVSSWTNSTSSNFQYFVQNTVDTSDFSKTPTPSAAASKTSTVYFNYANTTGTPTISYRWIKADGTTELKDMTGKINFAESAHAYGVVENMTKTGSYYTTSLNAASSVSPAIAAADTGCYIEWTVTFSDSVDGKTKTAVAYTYVYKPYVVPVGAAGKVRCTDGKDHDNSQITWITGVHYVASEASEKPHYPNYITTDHSGTNGLAVFLNREDISGAGYIGRNTSGNKEDKMFFSFYNSVNSKSYAHVNGYGKADPNVWMKSGSSANTFNKASFAYRDWKTGDDITMTVKGGGVGGIYIDTSRYTNLNQIPNLGVGMMMTDNEDTATSDNGAWKIGDYTNYTGAKYDGDKSQSNGDYMRGTWNEFNYTIAGEGTPDNRHKDYDKIGVKYAGAWYREILSGTSATYKIKASQMNNQNKDWITVSCIVSLNATQTNKSELRNAVRQASTAFAKLAMRDSYDSIYYYNDAAYQNFVSKYKQAYMELTKVDGGVTAGLASELLESMNELNIKVSLHGNGAALSPDYKIVKVGLQDLVNVNVADFGIPSRKGYTFKGWTLTANDGSAADGILSGQLQVGPRQKDVYATWSLNDYTATFRAMPYGRFGTSSSDTVIHYNVKSTFTVPENYTRDYYIFNNTWNIVSTDSSDWGMGLSLNPGYTSTVGKTGNIVLEPNVTPVQYTVSYDSDGGSLITDDSVKTYNIESTHSLPSSMREGYSFIGWTVVSTDDAKWEAGKAYSAGYKFTGMHGNVSLKAKWETLTSTVTLNLGAGESIVGNTVLTYAYSSSLALNTPVKKGYTFKGWRVTAAPGSGNTWIIGDEYLLAAGETGVTLPGGKLGDVTLTPVWEANSYTVTFNSDGGTVYQPISYTVEKTVTLPKPVKNGYTFAGWSVILHDDEYNWTASGYSGNQSLSGMYGSVTLKANWTKTGYTVTFNANGGTVSVPSLPYDIESGTPNLPTPVKNGYSFNGWTVEQTDAAASWTVGTVYTDALPAGNYGSLTLKAQWKPVSYIIRFSDGNEQTYNIEQTFTLPASARAGYDFVKWTVTSTNGNWGDVGTAYTTSDSISGKYGDVVLTAEYTPRTYTVEYQNAAGAELLPKQTFKTGDDITLADYAENGFMFGGWTVKTGDGNWGVGNLLTDKTVSGKYGNVVLVPKLDAITYTITFLPDGGNAVPSTNYTVLDGVTLPSTEKYGYDLVGWTVEENDGNWQTDRTFTAGTQIYGCYGNVTLKAKWTPKVYDITFITGTGEQVVHSEYGQETPTLPGDYSKPADAQYTYTFDHWEPALSKVTGNATYTAVYTAELNSYTVTWKIEQTENGGDYKYEHTTWKYGETPAYDGVPSQAVAAGADHKMRFIGWTPEVTAVTGNIIYTAQFEQIANPQTVEWYNGSTLLASTEWGIGEVPVYHGADPARNDADGYKFVFVGWAATDGGEKIDTLPAIVKGQDVKYYAVFEKQPQSYTLTLNGNGGTVPGGSPIGYTYNEANTEITFPAPEKSGYEFKGWRVDSTDGTWTVGTVYNAGTVRVNAYGNASLTAQWEAVTYTLTFAGEGASVPSMTYTVESDGVLPTAEKEGGELVGWLVSVGDGSWIQGTSVSPAFALKGSHGNATLTPVYKAKTYTIKWISGDYVQTTEVQFGSAVYAFEPVAKQGYTAEWDSEVPATMPAHDLVFTAVYKPIEYFLRLNLNGGTGAESFYYTSDTEELLPTPVRSGATFIGWRVVSSSGNWNVGTLVAGGASLKGRYGSTTLTAQWQLDIYTVTWVAGDETRVTRWYHGMTPSFDGTPYKSPDNNYSYIFSGWDKEIVPVTGDVTYTAIFDKTERVYTVTWNVDGVTTVQHYSYGEMPVYEGEAPSRPSTAEYDFFFEGWSPEVAEVTDDVTYVAQFRVFVKLQGLSLNKSAMFLDIDAGESLTADIYPSTASAKDVLWASSNESVAAVDAVGRVTAVSAGIAIVSVSSGDGAFKAYCVVTVAPKLTTYIEITAKGVSTTNQVGNSVQLYAAVKPDDATDRTFRWTSDNPGIASVDEFGMVRFNSAGTTTVRVITTDGYAQGSIEVTSVEKATEEQMKNTYGIRFLPLACEIYLIDDNGNRHTFTSEQIVCVPEGATVRFRPARPYYIIANGEQLPQEAEYVLENIQKNYIIASSKAEVVPPKDPDDAPSFIKKLQDFFRKIVQFFKKLFGAK